MQSPPHISHFKKFTTLPDKVLAHIQHSAEASVTHLLSQCFCKYQQMRSYLFVNFSRTECVFNAVFRNETAIEKVFVSEICNVI
jgi:hypothetical protein